MHISGVYYLNLGCMYVNIYTVAAVMVVCIAATPARKTYMLALHGVYQHRCVPVVFCFVSVLHVDYVVFPGKVCLHAFTRY